MTRRTAYRALCAALGGLLVVAGVAFWFGFFRALAPDAPEPGPIPVGPNGAYFIAFTGCALVAWGGSLLGAARRPESGRSVGTATAWALVMSALYRLFAWFMGDFAFLGELLRVEAAVFLLLALAFVWLRPPAVAAAAA